MLASGMAAILSRGDDLRPSFYFRFYFVSFLFCICVENIKILVFSDILRHSDDTFHTFNTIVADDLATQGTRETTVMVMT